MPTDQHPPVPPLPDEPLPRLATELERTPSLDGAAGLLDRIARAVVPSAGRVRDELRGRSVGHPVHSVLTDLPTALTGLADFRALSVPARRVAVVHASFNAVGTFLALASWRARRSGRPGAGALLTMAGMGAAGAGGYLGGHLAQTMREPRHVPGAG